MARLGLKLLKGEPFGPAYEEGYIHRGIRKNFFKDKRGSLRAIDMLLQKNRRARISHGIRDARL